MRDWIEQVLRFLHLPSLEFMNRQRELGRRISQAEARIRRLKQERIALEDGTFEYTLSVPAKTAAVMPGLYSPPTSPEELPAVNIPSGLTLQPRLFPFISKLSSPTFPLI